VLEILDGLMGGKPFLRLAVVVAVAETSELFLNETYYSNGPIHNSFTESFLKIHAL